MIEKWVKIGENKSRMRMIQIKFDEFSDSDLKFY